MEEDKFHMHNQIHVHCYFRYTLVICALPHFQAIVWGERYELSVHVQSNLVIW